MLIVNTQMVYRKMIPIQHWSTPRNKAQRRTHVLEGGVQGRVWFKGSLCLKLLQIDSIPMFVYCGSVPRKFWGIVGQDHPDSKSNRLHVVIFQSCFI